MLDEQRWATAPTFEAYVEGAKKNRELWDAIHQRATVPADLVARVRALPGSWKLLVLSEDWCGDAVNLVPVVARLAERAPNLELRVLARDESADLMNAHLTGGARSIPVVIVYDARLREVGWWGPRPRELQEWFLREGKPLPHAERYPRMRAWYARDRGRSTLEEIVALLEDAALRKASA